MRWNKISFSVATLVCLIGLGVSCISRQSRVLSSSHQWSTIQSSDTDAQLWYAVINTIRRQGLKLDRVDRLAGVISTYPEMSQQLFEFWRHDVDSTKDLWESAINPIRRRVVITLQSSPDELDQMTLEVAVTKQRLSSLDRQFNSTGTAYQYFGTQLPATTGQPVASDTDDIWIDLGRDLAMEDYLLRKILHRAGLTVPDSVE